jgi:hypothetical protein
MNLRTANAAHLDPRSGEPPDRVSDLDESLRTARQLQLLYRDQFRGHDRSPSQMSRPGIAADRQLTIVPRECMFNFGQQTPHSLLFLKKVIYNSHPDFEPRSVVGKGMMTWRMGAAQTAGDRLRCWGPTGNQL